MSPHPKSVSIDLKRAAFRILFVHSFSAVSAHCDISQETVRQIVKLHQQSGDVVSLPSNLKKGRIPMLPGEDLSVSYLHIIKLNDNCTNTYSITQYLEELVEGKSDLYLSGIKKLLRNSTDKTLSTTMLRQDFDAVDVTNERVSGIYCSSSMLLTYIRYIQLTRAADERNVIRGAIYPLNRGEYQPIFVDESRVNTRLTARRRSRWRNFPPASPATRFTVLPPVSMPM
jgi:hypothetical protein